MGAGTDTAADEATLERFWEAAGLPDAQRPYLRFQARRYPSIVHALAPIAPFTGKAILDVGGGAGSLSVQLHEAYGGSYDLAEYVPPGPKHQAALAERGVGRQFHLDLTVPAPLTPAPSDYDLVLFVEVLEHLLANPVFLFREFWDHLKPGGHLFLTTPNQARLRNRVRLVLGRSIKEPGRYPLNPGTTYGHVIEYGRRELDQLAWVEGFAPVASGVCQQPPPRSSWAQRAGTAVLNSRLGRRLELGDDILALYRKVERPVVHIRDPSGRL